MKIYQKIVLGFLCSLVLLSSFAFSLPDKAKAVGSLDSIARGLFQMEIKTDCEEDKTAGEAWYHSCSSSSSTGQDRGAFGAVVGLTYELYDNPPASGIVYAQDRWNTFKSNLTGEVYAQDSDTYFPGLGFNLLESVRPFWAWARNISYGLFIIVFIAIAIQILLRQKIDGQNPVTLANSIPGAIIALALVSLSYAITGFSIDLITLGTNFVRELFINTGLPEVTGDIIPTADKVGISVWGTFGTAIDAGGYENTADALGDVVGGISTDNQIIDYLTNAVQAVSEHAQGSALLSLIFGTAILFAALKVFLELLRRYVQIIFNVVISPIFFLFGALPGGLEKAVMPFLRGILANSVIFIAIYGIFAFIIAFMKSTSGEVFYVPPLLGVNSGGGEGGIPLGSIKALIAYATFLTTPLIPDMIQKALNAPDLTEIIQNIQARTGQAAGTAKSIGVFVAQSLGRLFNIGQSTRR